MSRQVSLDRAHLKAKRRFAVALTVEGVVGASRDRLSNALARTKVREDDAKRQQIAHQKAFAERGADYSS